MSVLHSHASAVLPFTVTGAALRPMIHTAGFIPDNLNLGVVDEVIGVKEGDSAPISKEINQLDGIPVGISSGAVVWAALEVARRPENKGKIIVAVIPSSSERYLSSWLFADINAESDSLEELYSAAA